MVCDYKQLRNIPDVWVFLDCNSHFKKKSHLKIINGNKLLRGCYGTLVNILRFNNIGKFFASEVESTLKISDFLFYTIKMSTKVIFNFLFFGKIGSFREE